MTYERADLAKCIPGEMAVYYRQGNFNHAVEIISTLPHMRAYIAYPDRNEAIVQRVCLYSIGEGYEIIPSGIASPGKSRVSVLTAMLGDWHFDNCSWHRIDTVGYEFYTWVGRRPINAAWTGRDRG